MKPKPPKQSEADLCAAFIAWAERQGWTAYAETAGFDIVLAAADGAQVGIQAKLGFNATLMRQTAPSRSAYFDAEAPDFRGVLLPKYDRDINEALNFCGFVYFHPRHARWHRSEIAPGKWEAWDSDFLPGLDRSYWLDWCPLNRITLPAYIPDVRAGASCPTQLTTWKIGALRITAILEARGHVTPDDFKREHVDRRRWVPSGWLIVQDGKMVRGPHLRFDQQHPRVYAQILAETKEAMAAEIQEQPVKSGKSKKRRASR